MDGGLCHAVQGVVCESADTDDHASGGWSDEECCVPEGRYSPFAVGHARLAAASHCGRLCAAAELPLMI
jgi:hypothetical protein